MTSSNNQYEPSRSPPAAKKFLVGGTHLEIHTVGDTLLDAVDNNFRPGHSGRSLSLRITDLIDEAFPLPAPSVDDVSHQLFSSGGEDSRSMDEATRRRGSCLPLSLPLPPPAYIPLLQQPPSGYNATGGSLADQLPDSFSVPTSYDRLSPLISPLPDHPYNTYYDLMLLAPAMRFGRFLEAIEHKATAYILAERNFNVKRLLPDETIVCAPEIKVRTSKDGLFRRVKVVVRSAVEAEDWPAVVSMLRERVGDVEFKLRFWTERPGSLARVLKKRSRRWVALT